MTRATWHDVPMALVIDTPEGIAHFQMARVIAALRLETGPCGLRVGRGSLLALVARDYGIVTRSKKVALAQMEEKYLQAYGRRYGSK